MFLKYRKMDEAGEGDPGDGGQKWFDSLPDEYKANETVQNAPDLGTFVKQALDTASFVGNSVRIPGPDAGQEDIQKFHQKLVEKVPGLYYMPSEEDAEAQKALFQKLGKPAEITGYELKIPEGYENDVDESFMENFPKWAHELNLTKKQAEGMFNKYSEQLAGRLKSMREANAESIGKVKNEWGAAFDSKMNKVNALLDKTGAPDSVKEAVKNNIAGGDTLKWFAGLAESMMGGKPVVLDQEGAPDSAMTPSEAQAQINEIMARKEYWDAGSPQQKDLVKKVVELRKLADPAASTEPPARAGFGFNP